MNLVEVVTTLDSLTTCSTGALRNGYFENMSIIDSKGLMINIIGAKKLHGVGLLWGYRIFRYQRIKVELFSKNGPAQTSIADVKQRVLNSFRKWHGWASRGDFNELRDAVKNASSIPEIITLLQSRDVTAK